MNLAASASDRPGRSAHSGYAMAALLVAMSVMAIIMSAALPTWKHTLQREKEEELVFRGNQYARAIGQYQRKYANASPPSLDVLIEQRLLRKKFKDPMSPNEDGEFQLLYVSNLGKDGKPGAGAVIGTTPGSGGIMGVVSKNTSESIRTFNGKNRYDEWQFVALQQSAQAGSGGPPGSKPGPGPAPGSQQQGSGPPQGQGQDQGRTVQPQGR